jgi:hypothetical protein
MNQGNEIVIECKDKITRIKSIRNAENIIFRNNLFRIANKNSSMIIWRCNKKSCSASVFTTLEYELISFKNHKHPQLTDTEVNLLKAKRIASYYAHSSNARPNKIVATLLASVESSDRIHLPKTKTLKQNIRNQRKNMESFTYCKEDDIANEHKVTLSKAKWLLHDSGIHDVNRIIVFANELNYEYISSATTFLMDGTFYTVPVGFYQLYVIHALIYQKYFPVIYCFLPNKDENTYRKLFSIIREKLHLNDLNTVIMDFEQAAMNAVTLLGENVLIYNCLFHYGQILWRKLQSLSLATFYRDDQIYKRLVKKLLVLGFLPYDEMQEGFYEIYKQYNAKYKSANEMSFIEYYKKNFIGTQKMKQINCYYRTMQSIPLTNNICEGWNRGINETLTHKHPTLTTILSILQEKDMIVERSIEEAVIVNEPVKKDEIEKRKEDLLLDLCKRRKEYKTSQYLNAITYIYHWDFNK